MRVFIFLFFLIPFSGFTQSDRWQQHVEYDMEIDVDVENYRLKGKQKINYRNNSPDTLKRVFYHLYFNAFQPGSMMDVRSRTLKDPDPRVTDRIFNLKPDEIGYQKVNSLEQDGVPLNYLVEGTILEVDLVKPLLPGKSTSLELDFDAQVPLQIRRSGRDNKEGISLSMAQWYPKLCEYDYQGWHANPYVGREFYGVWGDFNVKIKIDRAYTVAGTGMVQNPQKVGHGYSEKDTKKKKLFQKKRLTWEFKAENVHDFVWAADPDYTHLVKTTDIGTELHYFFQSNDFTRDNWENLHNAMNIAQNYLNKHYGVYPYKTYAFIQGGDGGMEYPMATLITGERSYTSLVGVSIHEWVHSWYQMVLGTNESLYAWMDEGFTSFVSSDIMNYMKKQRIIPGRYVDNPHQSVVEGFARWAKTGNDESLSTHADHFTSNQAYGIAAYTKGSVFLKQLEYIIGTEDFKKGMKWYYEEWKFKHPNVNDFIRVMEKVSGLELDWYKEYWVNTTHTIDYGINGVRDENGLTVIDLEKIGHMPMPIDVSVKLKDGTMKHFYIPLRIMRGEKNGDTFNGKVQQDWPWTNQHYGLKVNLSPEEIEKVYIDQSLRFSDIDLSNNVWPKEEGQ